MALRPRTALVPLFLVSRAAVGYETALTRYFAVAKWSEYGYWVISIVMVGFALSGVVLSLWRENVCIGSFRLTVDEVPQLIELLRAGLDTAYAVARTRRHEVC